MSLYYLDHDEFDFYSSDQEKSLFDGELEYMEKEKVQLKDWLHGYVKEEEEFFKARQENKKRLEEAALSLRETAAALTTKSLKEILDGVIELLMAILEAIALSMLNSTLR